MSDKVCHRFSAGIASLVKTSEIAIPGKDGAPPTTLPGASFVPCIKGRCALWHPGLELCGDLAAVEVNRALSVNLSSMLLVAYKRLGLVEVKEADAPPTPNA